jgi:hypothetical protein
MPVKTSTLENQSQKTKKKIKCWTPGCSAGGSIGDMADFISEESMIFAHTFG